MFSLLLNQFFCNLNFKSIIVLMFVLICSLFVIHSYKLYPWHLLIYFISSMERPFLEYIYRNGPSLRFFHIEFGFWNGLQLIDICSQLSGQSSLFWNKNINECQQLFEQKQHGFVVMIEIFIILLLGYKILRFLLLLVTWFLCPTIRPLFRLV